MWLMVQFDVPADTKAQCLAYRRLRRELRFLGFEPFQKSVYLRWEEADSSAEGTLEQLVDWLPSEGTVAVLKLSDRTLDAAVVYENGVPGKAPEPPAEYILC
jgi:CRISPR-associated endonuclease Cas2